MKPHELRAIAIIMAGAVIIACAGKQDKPLAGDFYDENGKITRLKIIDTADLPKGGTWGQPVIIK